MALSTTTNSGSQLGAQGSLAQPAGQTNLSGASSSSVQTGTASDLLRSSQGITLTTTPVTTVNLHAATTQTRQAPAPAAHHVNGVLLGFSGALFLVAIALFWLTSRPVKNTTI